MVFTASSVPQLGLSLVAGSLTTLSPCVFPLLPLVLGGALQGSRLAPVAMGLGMAGAFAGIGMLPGALGPAQGIDGDTVRSGGAVMLIAFALVMLIPALGQRFTRWMLPIASGANAVSAKLDGGSWFSALALGGVLGLVWSPCSGPLLASALTLVAYASRSRFLRVCDWVLARMERVRQGFALLLGAMGVAILTGGDKWLEAKVLQWLPDTWVNFTVGV